MVPIGEPGPSVYFWDKTQPPSTKQLLELIKNDLEKYVTYLWKIISYLLYKLNTAIFSRVFLKQSFKAHEPQSIYLSFSLTPRLSGFENLYNVTLIFQNEVLGFFWISFIIWILLKNINDNFRKYSWKFVTTTFVKVIFLIFSYFSFEECVETTSVLDQNTNVILEKWILEKFRGPFHDDVIFKNDSYNMTHIIWVIFMINQR